MQRFSGRQQPFTDLPLDRPVGVSNSGVVAFRVEMQSGYNYRCRRMCLALRSASRSETLSPLGLIVDHGLLAEHLGTACRAAGYEQAIALF